MRSDAPSKILAALKALLDSTGHTSYNEVAPDNATYPFMTYQLDNSFSDGEATEVYFLYLHGWDSFTDGGGTARLENMLADAASELEHAISTSSDYSLRFILDGRRTIADTDTSIRHRRYIYQVRFIGKE